MIKRSTACFSGRSLPVLTSRSRVSVTGTGLIDEMEKAGHKPFLVHAAKAKLMMGQINKTDKLDARGLAILARNGTLPAIWIPPGELRDQRELPRMRLVLVSVRTKLKNRIHATFAKYAITFDEVSDIFGGRGRRLMEQSLPQLPPETRLSVKQQLQLIDQVEQSVKKQKILLI